MTDRVVLAVDDEAEIIESLRRALRGEAYRFVGTTSPREARDIVDRGEVDLIIADIDMPGINGLELVAHARRTQPQVVRILLTGDASLASAIDAINRGEVHRYFTKPWRNEPLRQNIREALARVDELRRRADADATVRTRQLLVAELERQYPGISVVHSSNGVHEIDVAHLRSVLVTVAMPALDRLLSRSAPPAPMWEERATTKRGNE
jgi:DNA-binding NtrC family response regulator